MQKSTSECENKWDKWVFKKFNVLFILSSNKNQRNCSLSRSLLFRINAPLEKPRVSATIEEYTGHKHAMY